MKKRILFINFGGIGDEILFLPSIISVKKEFPDSYISLALESRSKSIVTLTDVVDDVICADLKVKNKYAELLKLLFSIWTKKFDIVVASGSNKFISIFLFLTGIKRRYGYNTGKLSELLLTEAVKLNKNQYAVNMYHDLVIGLTKNKTELPQINIQKKDTEKNTVVIHPGVSLMSMKKGIIKTIPAETWAKVISLLSEKGKNVILAGGPDDSETIEKIRQIVPAEKYTDYYGKTKNLRELAELISSAEVFLCSDSAPLHIAAALGTKTFVIFGSTDDKKLIPQSDRIVPIKTNSNCPIAPCLWEKRQTTCESLDCLKISAEQIVNTICDKIV